MKCDPNLERVFKFFEHYIFEMIDENDEKHRRFKPTTAMQLLYDKLFENE